MSFFFHSLINHDPQLIFKMICIKLKFIKKGFLKINFSGKSPIPQGTKPVLSFAGDQWEAESETVDYPLVRNLLLDFYRGETAKSIRLKGLELFIQFTLVNDVIAMRTYQVKLIKSGMDQPRVELESIGPGKKY